MARLKTPTKPNTGRLQLQPLFLTIGACIYYKLLLISKMFDIVDLLFVTKNFAQ